jgi:PPOX class probable F420-dependent enzyme
MTPIPDSVKKLIETKAYASFATLGPDGSPHVATTWVDHEGDLVIVNTFEGSQKQKNAARDQRVALTIMELGVPFNVATVRGRVREITVKGAEEHIDKMANKYMGQDKYPRRSPGEKRILIKIEPTKVIAPRAR